MTTNHVDPSRSQGTSPPQCDRCLGEHPTIECGYSPGRAAGKAVARAIQRGDLLPVISWLCVDCGEPAEAYDHRDYNKPLDVVPVCYRCNYRRGSAIPGEPSKALPDTTTWARWEPQILTFPRYEVQRLEARGLQVVARLGRAT